MPGTTITLFLLNDDAQNLRLANISNWNGQAIAAPRTELSALLKRAELEKPGIYLLLGISAESGKPYAYIGEAEVLRDRLRQHRTKEWTQAITFLSQGDNFTKAHIRYLEGRLIEDAQKIGRFVVHNSVSSGAKLPEYLKAEMEAYLTYIRQLLPILGCDMLVPVGQAPKAKGADLICTIRGLVARGQRTPKGFVVYKDSQAALALRKSAELSAPWLVKLREQLLEKHILVADGDHLCFSKDFEFTSPSAAAAIIHGGNADGPSAWKNSEGKKLKELEAAVG